MTVQPGGPRRAAEPPEARRRTWGERRETLELRVCAGPVPAQARGRLGRDLRPARCAVRGGRLRHAVDAGQRGVHRSRASRGRSSSPLLRSSSRRSSRSSAPSGGSRSNPIAVGVTGFYTSFFRGTPLIVQLFLIYLALPQIGLALRRFLGRTCSTLRRAHRRHHRPRAQLRRLHDRDLPGRDPVGRPRAVGGGRCARHDATGRRCAASSCRRRSG